MRPSRQDYYTYIYLDPRRPGIWHTDIATFFFEPIYVGEGRKLRMYAHIESDVRDCNRAKVGKIKKIIAEGYELVYFKVAENLLPDEAVAVEASLIRQIGTIAKIDTVPHGPLTNLQLREGKKYILSQESIYKMVQTKLNLPEEVKKERAEIRSAVQKETWQNEEMRARRIEGLNKAIENQTAEQKATRVEAVRQGLLSRTATEKEETRLMKRENYENKSDEYKKELSKKLAKGQAKQQMILTHDGAILFVDYLRGWCQEKGINYSSISNTKVRGSFWKGYHLLGDVKTILG